MRVKLIAINGRFTHSSLALFHVRNELEQHIHHVTTEIVQFTIRDSPYEMLLQIFQGQPDAIFFSSYIWNSELVTKLVDDLHRMFPACLLVVGGPQAAIVGENCDDGACTVVRGAIEAVGKQFYVDLVARSIKELYCGSFFNLAARGKKFVSPYRAGDFTTHLQNRNIYYESSRGCPFSCTYCLSSAESGIVHKGLVQIKEEMDQIMVHEPRVVRFVDRTFNDRPERALAIWRMVLGYGGETMFHFEIAPDRMSEEIFQFLHDVEPGRFQFEIGIQSTNQATLEAIRRKIDPGSAAVTVSRLAEMNNIHLHADLILGLPFESEDSYLKSFADVFAMGPHYIQMGLLKMLPDTDICRYGTEFGYLSCERPPYQVLANSWLDARSLHRLYWFSECVEKFYNNRYFPSLWSYLRQKQEDIRRFFERLLEAAAARHLFQLAPTHQFLVSILREIITGRPDEHLLSELIIYDWFRCGQKNLPEFLNDSPNSGRSLQDRLYRDLPDSIAGVYDKKNRNIFFKQSVFYRFSNETLRAAGFAEDGGTCLAFLLEREKTLHRLQCCVQLPS